MRYRIRIELLNVDNPKVWREMLVPMDMTFHDFHKMIQCGMGWRNSHLYSFKENERSRYINIDSPYYEEYALDASTISVRGILLNFLNQFQLDETVKDKLHYIYDFGDSWHHTIEILDIDYNNTVSPEIVAGEGACPPEDCGGEYGYEDLKMNIRTGQPSEIHGDDYRPWLKGLGYKNFDPDVFDIETARKKLKRWRTLK